MNHIFNRRSSWRMCKINRQSSLQNKDNYVCFIFKSVTKCTRNCAIANRSSSASYNSIKNTNEDDKCILDIHATRMCQKI